MTHVTYRLTAKNRDQVRNPMLSNRVRAIFTFYPFKLYHSDHIWWLLPSLIEPAVQVRLSISRLYVRLLVCALKRQEAQLSPRDRAMRRVSWNLANCHATVQKLLVRQVLNQVFSLIDACDKIVLDDL